MKKGTISLTGKIIESHRWFSYTQVEKKTFRLLLYKVIVKLQNFRKTELFEMSGLFIG